MKNYMKLGIVVLIAIVAVAAYFLMTGDSSEMMDTTMGTEMMEEETEMTYEYTDVDAMEAKALIDSTPDLTIIDVSPHYDDGHLPGAVNYYSGALDDAIPTLDKDAPYLVYCHFESASRAGAQKLVDAGFTDVYRLEGDYGAWVDAGYDVEM